jgi:hypothetical protein
MARPPNVELGLITRQLSTLMDRVATVQDSITVLTGMTQRLDGTVEGLATEFRGMYSILNRMNDRVRTLEGEPTSFTPRPPVRPKT